MKTTRTTLLVLAMMLSSVLLIAQEKFSQVKVYPADNAQRLQAIGLLDIDHFIPTEDGGIVSEVSAIALKRFSLTGIKYKVLIDDVAKALEVENEKFFAEVRAGRDPKSTERSALNQVGKTVDNIIATPAAFQVFTGTNNLGGYYTLSQMYAAVDALVAAYPTIAQKIVLGSSVEGRPIVCVKISDNVAIDELNEPEVLYLGLQHAREAIGGASMIFFMQYLCENYAVNAKIQALVNNREVYIVPCVNPDGYERNRRTNPNGGGSQRKNRRINAGSDSTNMGVDLNRNYGIDWGNCPGADNTSNSCGTSIATGGTHYGSGAFSEPETQAIRSLVLSHHFVASIDQHAYGPYYSLPFGRPSLHTMNSTDAQFYTHIPALMGTYNGMRAGNSPESVGYEVAGGVKDWLLMGDITPGGKQKVYGMTGEGGANGGTAAFGSMGNFWPPANQIINLCRGMIYQDLQLLYAAGSYVDIQDVDDINLASKTGSLNFRLTRIGLGNDPVTVTLIPIRNIKTVGSPVVVGTGSMPNFNDTYSGSISYTLHGSLPNEQMVQYAWRVETGGYLYYDTITKFFAPQTLLSDNMEGTFGTNWTGAGGWAFTTNDKYLGTKSLAESPTGNYTSGSTRTLTYSGPTMNVLNATSVWLSFWIKHRAENFHDKLQVQVSTNGSTWVPVVGSTTVQEPNLGDGNTLGGQPAFTGIRTIWTHELFDLTAFAGMTNNLRLRMVFTSDANVTGGFQYQVDDGFFIDNLVMMKSTVPQVTLPVNFISFTGKLLSNKTVQLDWEAETDGQHDYFEMQKSADGVNFKPIANVYDKPYQVIDKTPYRGNNYYRIKQYDKDGKFMYSKVITVAYNTTSRVTIFPNPLMGDDTELTIRVLDATKNTVHITVTDAQGRSVYDQEVRDIPVSREIKINTATWTRNMYVVKVTDKSGEYIAIQKIIKK